MTERRDSLPDVLSDLRDAGQEDFARRTSRLTGATSTPPSTDPGRALVEAQRVTRSGGRSPR